MRAGEYSFIEVHHFSPESGRTYSKVQVEPELIESGTLGEIDHIIAKQLIAVRRGLEVKAKARKQ